jgi:hypothetical protein
LKFILLIFYFVFISTAASDYFSPNVASLAKLLKLPADVAGVTLLAVANASGDLISNIVSIPQLGTATLAVSELLGAGLITTLFVFGCVNVLASKPDANGVLPLNNKLNREGVIRDCAFYFLTLAIIIWMILEGQIKWYQGFLMVFVYFLYVVIVVMMNNAGIRKAVTRLFKRKKILITSETNLRNESEIAKEDEIVTFPTIFVENPEGEVSKKFSPSRPSSPALSVRSNGSDALNESGPSHQSTRRRNRSGSLPLASLNGSTDFLQPSSSVSMDRRKPPSVVSLNHSKESSKRSTSEEIGENVINLTINETVKNRMRGSISSAVELWDAIGNTSRGSPNSDIEMDDLIPEPDNKSAADVIEGLAYGDNKSSIERPPGQRFEHLTAMDLVDYCPTCYKTAHRTQTGAWGHIMIFIDHTFPILRLWALQGAFGKLISILNIVPVFLMSLSVPVCALLESEEQDPMENITENADAVDLKASKPVCMYGKVVSIPYRHRFITAIQMFSLPFLVCFSVNGNFVLQLNL